MIQSDLFLGPFQRFMLMTSKVFCIKRSRFESPGLTTIFLQHSHNHVVSDLVIGHHRVACCTIPSSHHRQQNRPGVHGGRQGSTTVEADKVLQLAAESWSTFFWPPPPKKKKRIGIPKMPGFLGIDQQKHWGFWKSWRNDDKPWWLKIWAFF